MQTGDDNASDFSGVAGIKISVFTPTRLKPTEILQRHEYPHEANKLDGTQRGFGM
jgi:hypothetical protein